MTNGRPNEAVRRGRDIWRQLPWFFGVLWKTHAWGVALNVLLVCVQGLFPAAQLLLLQRLYDAVAASVGAGSGAWRTLLMWIGAFTGLSVLQGLVTAARAAARSYVRERASWRLQQLVILRAGEVRLDEYEQPEFFDRLQRAQQAAVWRSFMTFEVTLQIGEIVIHLLSFLGMLVGAHVALPLLLVAGALPTLVSHVRRGRETYALYRSQTPEQRRVNYLVTLLTDRDAAKEIRLYDLGKHLLERWHDAAATLRDQRLRLVLKQQIRMGGARLASIAGYTGAVLLLVWLGVHQAITIGAFVTLSQAANRFQMQLGQVLRTVSQVYEELLYLADLREFATTPPEGGEGRIALEDGPATIEFEDVSFSYPGGKQVLSNVSFVIRPGEKVALVGQNGAGKTTLVKLLLGLYYPTYGRVLVDGVDTRALDPRTLRRKSAAVFQDFLRYQLSAGENIGFGRVERLDDRDAILAAADAGGAQPVLNMLPEGLETVLGRYFEGGRDLSGGQWQKLAIARAYFRNAQILVLDEPTAALDPRAELEVFQQFRALAGGKTAVFVSHRMASARIADRILVMQNGRLIEEGHHDVLVARNGEYARMFHLQAQWYRDELPEPVVAERRRGVGRGKGAVS